MQSPGKQRRGETNGAQAACKLEGLGEGGWRVNEVGGQLKTPHSTTTPLSSQRTAARRFRGPRGGDEQREDTRGEEAGGCRRALSEAGEGPAEDAGERGGREAFRG